MSHVRFNPIFGSDLFLSSSSVPVTSADYHQAFCFVRKSLPLEMHACTWAGGEGAIWSQLFAGRQKLT
jgi:hypothetical protein